MRPESSTGPGRRQTLSLLAGLALWPGQSAQAQAEPSARLAQTKGQVLPFELLGELPQAQLVGQGILRFFGLRIYTIRAWSEGTIAPQWWIRPLALEIEYARELDGAEIARRSLKEMRRQSELTASQSEQWLTQMREAFPNVRAGDRISGVLKSPELTRFFVNGKAVKDLQDAAFTRLFFGIWLSPKTSEPGLRDALLGAGQ